MEIKKIIIPIFSVFFLLSCGSHKLKKIVLVKNTVNAERSFETVELSKDFLSVDNLSNIGIKDVATNELLVTQLVDQDGDTTFDTLLFQPVVPANTEKEYEIIILSNDEKPNAETLCFSRFIPERMDDYAWENDRVAFRVYGPKAQNLFENKDYSGIISSGVDAWLKKVEYPIINKWYKKYVGKTGTYHEDTGEGLDNFHVGISRGVGGISVKKDSAYYSSENYAEWKTITNGPLRTSFQLKYNDWDANGTRIEETKTISLDRGQNLSKFQTEIKGIDQIAAGLTLHEKDGDISESKENGWLSYYQPHGKSELGMAIVATDNSYVGHEKYIVQNNDLCNAYAHLKVNNNKVSYYTGFGWKESGQFTSKKEWHNYLDQFALKLKNPLTYSLKNE